MTPIEAAVTSGNGRYSYLAAYGYAIKTGKTPAQARAFVTSLFKNEPVLDTAAARRRLSSSAASAMCC